MRNVYSRLQVRHIDGSGLEQCTVIICPSASLIGRYLQMHINKLASIGVVSYTVLSSSGSKLSDSEAELAEFASLKDFGAI